MLARLRSSRPTARGASRARQPAAVLRLRRIVTGASSGIGAAVLRRLCAEGATVVGVDIAAPSDADDAAVYLRCDVADCDAVSAMVDEAEALLSARGVEIDVLVNNAGIGSVGPAATLPVEEWRRVMEVNTSSVFYACRRVIPIMQAKGGGVIINIASISGLRADYSFGAYNASKAATINYTRTLALDHGRHGIRVNAVCPGLIETPLTAGLHLVDGLVEKWTAAVPLGRAGTPNEIAATVAFLASDDASYLTGAAIVVDGGITAGTGQPDVLALLEEG